MTNPISELYRYCKESRNPLEPYFQMLDEQRRAVAGFVEKFKNQRSLCSTVANYMDLLLADIGAMFVCMRKWDAEGDLAEFTPYKWVSEPNSLTIDLMFSIAKNAEPMISVLHSLVDTFHKSLIDKQSDSVRVIDATYAVCLACQRQQNFVGFSFCYFILLSLLLRYLNVLDSWLLHGKCEMSCDWNPIHRSSREEADRWNQFEIEEYNLPIFLRKYAAPILNTGKTIQLLNAVFKYDVLSESTIMNDAKRRKQLHEAETPKYTFDAFVLDPIRFKLRKGAVFKSAVMPEGKKAASPEPHPLEFLASPLLLANNDDLSCSSHLLRTIRKTLTVKHYTDTMPKLRFQANTATPITFHSTWIAIAEGRNGASAPAPNAFRAPPDVGSHFAEIALSDLMNLHNQSNTLEEDERLSPMHVNDDMICEVTEDIKQPLEYTIHCSVTRAVSGIHQVLSPTLLRVLCEHYRLPIYFELIQKYWLTKQGFAIYQYTQPIFAQIVRGDDWQNIKCLEENLRNILSSEEREDAVVSEASLVLPELRSGGLLCYDNSNIDCLKPLGLKLQVGFPINIILTEQVMSNYNDVFLFLVQLQYVKYRLVPLSLLSKAFQQTSVLLSRVQLMCYRVITVINIFHDYFVTKVDETWTSFMSEFQKCVDISSCREVQDKGVSRLLQCCLYSPDTKIVRSVFVNVLNQSLLLGDMYESILKDASDHGALFDKVAKLEKTVSDSVQYLKVVIAKLAGKDIGGHLSGLLMRLDFNKKYNSRSQFSYRSPLMYSERSEVI